MRFKTNMIFDRPNANGRIYKEQMFKKSIADALHGAVLIYPDWDSASKQDICKAVGVINRFFVKDKELSFGGAIFDDKKYLKEFFESGNIQLTTAGYGRIEDGEIKDYKFIATFLVDKDGNGI